MRPTGNCRPALELRDTAFFPDLPAGLAGAGAAAAAAEGALCSEGGGAAAVKKNEDEALNSDEDDGALADGCAKSPSKSDMAAS